MNQHERIPMTEADLPAPIGEPTTTSRQLPFLKASGFAGKPYPERKWQIEGLIPAGTVAMLSGDGATGKSLLGLQLSVASVAGRQFLEKNIMHGPCLFLTAEDDIEEVHRRLIDICTAENIAFDELSDLHISSLAGEDALLAVPASNAKSLQVTPLYLALEAQIKLIKPTLVVLDTLADLFGGNEIERREARAFIGFMKRLTKPCGSTILLLAHPSQSGMASGSGTSGSTAWNNSVRSRLYFERIKSKEGVEDDPDVRRLKTGMKPNYGPAGGELKLRWHKGVFIVGKAPSSDFMSRATSKAEEKFLELVAAYTLEGRNIHPSNGKTFAPHMFSEDPRSERISKTALHEAMNRLFATGKIRVEVTGPPSRRYQTIKIA